MISKVLVANRGEIAIRAFRAAYELGIGTVAVYPYEDRNSLHRLKADESYQIGEVGHPVRAYLSVDDIVETARRAGADAIYPGYGFLSENPDLAAACAAAGITFVGPSADVLELTGNKARAIAAAREAGCRCWRRRRRRRRSTSWCRPPRTCAFRCSSRRLPAAAAAACAASATPPRCPKRSKPPAAKPSRRSATPTVYLEQAVLNPRHIEVQILADTTAT